MKEDTVTPFPGVLTRPGSTVWQFSLQAPSDLRHHFPTQWACRKSLGTRDLREANARAKALHAEWEAKFAALRRSDNPQRVALTPALTATIAAEVRRWVLQADDNMRDFPEGPRALLAVEHRQRLKELAGTPEGALLAQLLPMPSTLTIGGPRREVPAADPLAGLSDAEAGALARWNAAGAAEAALNMAGKRLRSVLPWAEAITRAMGLTVDWASPEGIEGLREVLKAYRQATEDASKRDSGALIDTPEPPPNLQPQQRPQEATEQANKAKPGHTYMDAFEAWLRRKPGRPMKSVAKFRRVAERLAELTDGKAIEDLTREDGRAIQNKLVDEAMQRGGGTSLNTAAAAMGNIKTLLNEAVDLGWISSSPLPHRGIPRVRSARRAWTRADLHKLFDDPLFRSYTLPTASMGGLDAAYWLPLLGLFTGARITELAQLGTKDIEHTEEAGWVLHITEDDDEGQRVKNTHSIRTVPVHPELIRLGLIDYWRAICEHGPGPLWPALPRTELNGAGGKFSQWFGKYKAAKGFGPELVFHSFRHTVETELRALRTPKYLIDGITGHAGKTVSDDYDHTTAATLREALDSLRFPGLHLPRVYRTPAWKASE